MQHMQKDNTGSSAPQNQTAASSPVGSIQMAGHKKSPRGICARTSNRPYFQLPAGDFKVRMRALVKGCVQVAEPS
jgi:hypothetical protein